MLNGFPNSGFEVHLNIYDVLLYKMIDLVLGSSYSSSVAIFSELELKLIFLLFITQGLYVDVESFLLLRKSLCSSTPLCSEHLLCYFLPNVLLFLSFFFYFFYSTFKAFWLFRQPVLK